MVFVRATACVEIADLIHEAELQRLRAGQHAAVGKTRPVVRERLAFRFVFFIGLLPGRCKRRW